MARDPNARDAKLIQYLNEAYGKEKQLETALQAHIAMTTRASYKKRLQQHLSETKAHARRVERRIRQLGGKAELAELPGPDRLTQAAGRVVGGAQRAAAAAAGPLHAIRGTGEQEKLLKNAKTEYQDEAEEIATYIAIEIVATEVGDKDTAKLAKTIRREEERMAGFLEKLIPQLAKAVVRDAVPRELRAGGSTRRASSGRKRSASRRSPASRSRSTSRRASPSRSRKSGTSGRSTSARSTTSRSRSSARSGRRS